MLSQDHPKQMFLRQLSLLFIEAYRIPLYLFEFRSIDHDIRYLIKIDSAIQAKRLIGYEPEFFDLL